MKYPTSFNWPRVLDSNLPYVVCFVNRIAWMSDDHASNLSRGRRIRRRRVLRSHPRIICSLAGVLPQ
jgi:hypothetical protein